MAALKIENQKIYLKHEPRGKIWDINYWTSRKFSCLGQEKNRAGIFQLRDICWETLHAYFSCYSFYPGNRDMTKVPMNNPREILILQGTDSWENNNPVYLRVDLDSFGLNLVWCFLSLIELSPRTDLRVNNVNFFMRFRCKLLNTNINLRAPDDMV